MSSNTCVIMVFKTIDDYFFIYFCYTQSHRVILPSGSLFFLRAAYSRRENDGGLYWCNATNSEGSAVSKNVTLTVAGEEICQSDQTFIIVGEQKSRQLFVPQFHSNHEKCTLKGTRIMCTHDTTIYLNLSTWRNFLYREIVQSKKCFNFCFAKSVFSIKTKTAMIF